MMYKSAQHTFLRLNNVGDMSCDILVLFSDWASLGLRYTTHHANMRCCLDRLAAFVLGNCCMKDACQALSS